MEAAGPSDICSDEVDTSTDKAEAEVNLIVLQVAVLLAVPRVG